jgi:hypothetical protein
MLLTLGEGPKARLEADAQVTRRGPERVGSDVKGTGL